jgi:UDP-GlcNAc:undecaprenyl-phosphate GlcNAc-1-phosphate transferase
LKNIFRQVDGGASSKGKGFEVPMDIVILLVCSALLSFLTVPLMLRLANKYKFYDVATERKVHTGTKPYLGGGAIFLAFTITSLIFLPKTPGLWIVLGGGAFFFLLGLVDDRLDLPAKVKLVLELLVTTLVVWIGMRTGLLLENPFGSIGFHPVFMWFSIPFSVLWIVGIANAVNLIDGLDGLASGVIFIACAVLTIAAAINPAVSLSPLLIIVMGSIAGYIRYNLYPSKIIMGDSGALFLGYIIAIISLSSFATPNRSIFLSLIPPAMALCVPILDTLLAILRRRRYGKRIFSADKNHFHHCLLQRGFSHPKVVYIVWGLSASFGIVSLVLSELIFQQVYLALALSGLVLFWAIYSAAGFGIFHIPEEDKALKEAAVSDDAKEVG